MFPAQDGVSDTMSPRAIIVGLKLDYTKHCQLEFGSYVQVHEEHDNSMVSRTTGAIALRPTSNAQGGYYFFSLSTGCRLSRNRWTALPMPQDVIDRVHTLVRRSNANRDLTFAWRDGTAIATNDDKGNKEDEDQDSDYDPEDLGDDSDSEESDDDDADHIVDDTDLPLVGVEEHEEPPPTNEEVEAPEEPPLNEEVKEPEEPTLTNGNEGVEARSA
jgi:hypothetical protein